VRISGTRIVSGGANCVADRCGSRMINGAGWWRVDGPEMGTAVEGSNDLHGFFGPVVTGQWRSSARLVPCDAWSVLAGQCEAA
jgi:hypothetical protein